MTEQRQAPPGIDQRLIKRDAEIAGRTEAQVRLAGSCGATADLSGGHVTGADNHGRPGQQAKYARRLWQQPAQLRRRVERCGQLLDRYAEACRSRTVPFVTRKVVEQVRGSTCVVGRDAAGDPRCNEVLAVDEARRLAGGGRHLGAQPQDLGHDVLDREDGAETLVLIVGKRARDRRRLLSAAHVEPGEEG